MPTDVKNKRWYPNLQGLSDFDARQAVQRAWDEIYSLRDRLDSLTAANPITTQGLSDSIGNQTLGGLIRPALESTGSYPLNVQNLLGRTATNQWTYVPQLPLVPSLLEGVANVGDGTLITLTSPDRPPGVRNFSNVKRTPSGIPAGLLLRYSADTHTFNPVQAIGITITGTWAELPNPAYLAPGTMYMPDDRAKTIYVVKQVAGPPIHNEWFYWAGVWDGTNATRLAAPVNVNDTGLLFWETDTQKMYRFLGGAWVIFPASPAWAYYSPSVSINGGAPGSGGASLKAAYQKAGTTCFFHIKIAFLVTTPAVSYMDFSLPPEAPVGGNTPGGDLQSCVASWTDDATQSACGGVITGNTPSPGNARIYVRSNTNVNLNLYINGFYQCS